MSTDWREKLTQWQQEAGVIRQPPKTDSTRRSIFQRRPALPGVDRPPQVQTPKKPA